MVTSMFVKEVLCRVVLVVITLLLWLQEGVRTDYFLKKSLLIKGRKRLGQSLGRNKNSREIEDTREK